MKLNVYSVCSAALMGELFPTKVEPAMAVYLMFRSFGHILGFGYAHFMCMSIKIYINGGVCLFATGLLTVFYKTNCIKKEKSTDWSVKV